MIPGAGTWEWVSSAVLDAPLDTDSDASCVWSCGVRGCFASMVNSAVSGSGPRTLSQPSVWECLNQCADEHLHYCHRDQGPTDHPWWSDALVHLFHTTGTQDPRLRLVHPTRAKQDAHTGPQVTSDVLHLHVRGYCRQGSLSPPTQGAADHPPAALLYILRDVLADVEQQVPNADVAWPEPLR